MISTDSTSCELNTSQPYLMRYSKILRRHFDGYSCLMAILVGLKMRTSFIHRER